ncbi:MAG: chorismate synthase [Limnochordales bacterium]|nr:MAG: chorismate synthase [Bacillota bacterium]
MPLRFLTAGESHGPALTAILEGMPAGVKLSAAHLNQHLRRRQLGYGRGRRMQIESDEVEILSGVRHGRTLGGPVALMIRNNDWPRWQRAMAVEAPEDPEEIQAAAEKDWRLRPVTRPRPGHADWPGALKYNFTDARNVLERASARETAMRVAVGAAAAALLGEFGIRIGSHVVRLGPVAAPSDKDAPPPAPETLDRADQSPVRCLDPEASAAMVAAVDEAKAKGETLGGVFEVVAWGVPPGLGSHVQWDRKLDARLAAAVMSIQAVKAVEFGIGFEAGARFGSQAHDPILVDGEAARRRVYRPTNRAGGIEGGMSNGQPIVLRAAMKPLATLYDPLPSIDMETLEPAEGAIERSDVTAVPAAAVVAEAAVAFELARAMIEKFGGDSLAEMRRSYDAYVSELARRGVVFEPAADA